MNLDKFYQILCTNGHLCESNVYVHDSSCSEEEWSCPDCNEPAAWRRTIDHESSDDYTPLMTIKEAIYTKCNLGQPHLTSPALYRIPKKDETNPTYSSVIAYVKVRLDLLVLDGVDPDEAMQRATSEASYDFTYEDDTVSIEGTEIVDVELKEVKK